MTEERHAHGAAAAPASPIAVLLPHREVFQRAGAGAVSLCVLDTTRYSRYRGRTLILGEPVDEALDPERFVPVARAPWFYGRRARRYLRGAVDVLRRRPPALIEIHNRPVYAAAVRAAFPGTPLLLYIHNDPLSMRGLREPGARTRALETFTLIVCVSDHVRRRMLEGLEDHPLGHKVRVVLNGVDTDLVRPAPPGDGAREIIFVGRLSPQKGGLLFARAAAALREALPDWRFIVIGARRFRKGLDSDYEQQVVAQMARLGAQGEITGYLPRDEVFRRLGRGAIAVIPSTWEEPFCLAAVEAMSAGCALVAARRGGLPEVVGDAGLLFSPDREDELAQAVRSLAQDPALLRRYQEAARARAATVLDIRRCSRRLDELRGHLLHEEHPS